MTEVSKRVHLVLGPGGVRTFAYLGAIQQLQADGYTFASISGCSAGSFVGALIAAGLDPAKLEDYFLKLDLRQCVGESRWFGIFGLFYWPFAMKARPGLPAILRELLPDDPKLRDLKIPFATIGVDLVTNSFIVYGPGTHGDMRISEVITIATAMPLVYAPLRDNGRIVIDAAVATKCPVWLSEVHDDDCPVVALNCFGTRAVDQPENVGYYLGRIMEASVASRDDVLLALMPRVSQVKIHCHNIESKDYKISRESKRLLIEGGRTAVIEASASIERRVREFVPAPSAKMARTGESGSAGPAQVVSTIVNHYVAREITMSTNNIQVGGNANLNIGSTLTNVRQSIETTTALPAEKRQELSKLVDEMTKQLKELAEKNPDEAALIAARLKEAVEQANQPPEKRKRNLLELSSEIMPGLLTTAGLVARFLLAL